jgi:uncharacterized membrane protein
VFGLAVPNKSDVPPSGLIGLLPEMLPKYGAYVISFIVLGVYWVGQHNMFMHIRRHDRVVLWLNLLFLMFIASTPFFAGLLTEYGDDTFALIAYAANLMLAGFALDAIWWYATTHRRLVDSDMGDDLITFTHRRILIAPALYLVTVMVAFISHSVARVLLVVIAMLYIFPNPLDHYHHKGLNGEDSIQDDE